MKIDFDEIINRSNTNSLKYDFAIERGKPEDILPLWVADMDFRAPQKVLEDINQAVSHGIFGYSDVKNEYFEAIRHWFQTRFNWEPEARWLVKTPGVVFAIAAAIKAFTKEGDGILIQEPVYYPFSHVIQDNKRRLVNSPLSYQNQSYSIDFVDFEQKIISEKVKLFILCSPHNPVGRVWRKEELLQLGEICLKHNVLIVSDEIHCDFTYQGHKHIVFTSLNEAFAENTILCTAPSKTFNLAGLQVSNIFIKNPSMRRKFKEEIYSTGYSQLNTLGLIACQSAYTHGEEWLNQLQDYLQENLNFVRSFLQEKLPQIKLVEPEGTYLIWLDCKELNLTDEELEKRIVHKAKLWLDTGTMFGEVGSGFQRINIACPKSLLEDALNRLTLVL